MSITKIYRKKKNKKKVVYRAEVYIRGVRLSSRYFDTKSEAYIWEENQKKKLEKGFEAQSEYENFTFKDCLQKYLKEYVPTLRQSTQQSLQIKMVYMKAKPLVNVKMKEINSFVIDHWIDWLLNHKTSKNPHRKSLIAELKVLTAILNWWKNYIDADFNVPVVKRHRDRCRYKHTEARRPDYFMKPKEVQDWIDCLKEKHSNQVYWRLAAFMVSTGVRVGEACGLLWSEVDFENSFVRIIRTIRWDRYTKHPVLEQSTKTSSSARALPLPENLIEVLKQMNEENKETGYKFVFHNERGEALKYNAIPSAFDSAFRALGLPWRGTHICRHTFATLALQATNNLSAVQVILGHTDQAITQRYAKAIALMSSETTQKTSQVLNLNLNKKEKNKQEKTINKSDSQNRKSRLKSRPTKRKTNSL